MKYMHIIDKTVQQIVIQKDSIDPDPASSLANIDVKSILSKMAVDGDRLRETEERLKKAMDRYKRLEKELDNLRGTTVRFHMSVMTILTKSSLAS
jgi:hypothetical protein